MCVSQSLVKTPAIVQYLESILTKNDIILTYLHKLHRQGLWPNKAVFRGRHVFWEVIIQTVQFLKFIKEQT